ncbi:AbrB/MazE/SpoVT family DNA-binding domain-containing protein [Clostridioides difficile]|uniref:AbrB/MazE/SpoVT family DNA-binding domain-containing protein n=1 Tax=Clostridioides difficile TaxID=1496 RepID=UPI0021C41E00|nr:AbrB/MazE/SpoVT family DNA-binding domain-containing protein [Clostridioides difficile]UUC40235.1 AbrB/MazE/SpoVT family DNA-binding domain-containing protein [Clostridioides difficile]
MEKRILKVLLSKSGSGSLSPKISLPATWIREMNITQEEREVEVYFENNEIRIKKKDLD